MDISYTIDLSRYTEAQILMMVAEKVITAKEYAEWLKAREASHPTEGSA